MNYLDSIVEQRLAEAARKGELSDLPGLGEPLQLDDSSLIPEELRMAYRVLRNSGFVPPEVVALRDIGDLERHINELPRSDRRNLAIRKLQLLRTRMAATGRFDHVLGSATPYRQRLIDRLGSEEGPVTGAPHQAGG
jgi:DnaJ-like protein